MRYYRGTYVLVRAVCNAGFLQDTCKRERPAVPVAAAL